MIAAAVVRDGDLLLVAKHAAPEVFYLPGGKPDDGEAPLACLAREVREELGAGIAAPAWWPRDRGVVLAPAIREHVVPALQAEGRL